MFSKTGLNNVLRMSVTSLVYCSLACARSTCAKWNSCIGDYFILDHLLNSYLWMPTKEKCYAIQGSRKMFTQLTVPVQVGYSGFQVTGMIEWSQKSRPKKIPGASSKTQKKSLDQKLTPQKFHVPVNLTFQTHKSQAKEIKSSLKAKGNSSDGKANWLNWSGWSLVHGRAPRDNADYCITCAM